MIKQRLFGYSPSSVLKFSKVNFPLRFINSAAAQFNKSTYNNNERNEEDEMIIPPQLFKKRNNYHPKMKLKIEINPPKCYVLLINTDSLTHYSFYFTSLY